MTIGNVRETLGAQGRSAATDLREWARRDARLIDTTVA
jgi:hypothetical protein